MNTRVDVDFREKVSVGDDSEPYSGAELVQSVRNDKTCLTRLGLRISQELSFEMWEQCGRRLSELVDSTAWCLGDWLVYGKSRFPDRYELAIRAAGLQYQTLRNYSWVSRRFPLERRRLQLSFQHHAEIASLPVTEQDWWLDQAEDSGWTTKQLRSRIRDQMARLAGKRSQRTEMIPRIRVESTQIDEWKKAAEVSGLQFENWVLWALDKAAAQTEPVLSGSGMGARPRG